LQPVGALIVNDDWGFKTQTMIAPETLRQFVFPWHKKIVETIHLNGKHAILHSCGNLSDVIDDIVDDMKFDAKHSFEDIILPVEQAWQQWHGRIAIMGGIDMDFLVRSEPDTIKERCRKILELTGSEAYALGSGNSIPTYVPIKNYLAMIETINQ
jgi:uroporphyrinogen decarboxylase